MSTQKERLERYQRQKSPFGPVLEHIESLRGEPGYTPVKGKDYFTEEEVRGMIAYVLSQVRHGVDGAGGKDGRDGKDGYTPILGIDFMTAADKKKIIQDLKEMLPKFAMPKMPSVKEIAEEVHKKKGKVKYEEIEGVPDLKDLPALIEFLKMGGFRGGAGTPGTSSGVNVATEKLLPTTAGSDITLNLAGLAHTFIAILGVYKNGQLLDPSNPTFGWSRAASTITVLNATTDDIFLIQYTY